MASLAQPRANLAQPEWSASLAQLDRLASLAQPLASLVQPKASLPQLEWVIELEGTSSNPSPSEQASRLQTAALAKRHAINRP
eukprot:5058672-Prymnesium_polylepis.1